MTVELDVAHPVVLRRGEGEALAEDREYLIKAALPELSLLESAFPRGEAVAPHIHDRHTDSFYVLEGELEFRLGEQTIQLPPGSFVFAPPRVVHSFSVATPEGARWLNLHAPDGGFAESRRARRDGRERRVPLDVGDPPPDGGRLAGEGTVRLPGEGERMPPTVRFLLKVGRPELTLLEFEIEPRFGTPQHVHNRHNDAYYVLDGKVEFGFGETTVLATAGTFLLIPAGVLHSWTNAGSGAARFLNIHAPGAWFDEYVRERAELEIAGRQPDHAFFERHDTFFVGDH